MYIPASDPRLSYFAPGGVERIAGAVRLERFPAEVTPVLRQQLGPLANVRSSSGCAVVFRTNSPWIRYRLSALRHHQLVPVGVACEVRALDGGWTPFSSIDLREYTGEVEVFFGTGLDRGEEPRDVALWLPLISTCAFTGLEIAPGTVAEWASLPVARWLALGDSLTQGFTVQCPTQCWVHRLSRHWNLPVWNLGVGGLKIEPEVFAWALRLRRWELVTIGLGSNHCWNDVDAQTAADQAERLVERVLAGGHERVVWLLPPYKPCEDGKGPREFMGVPLTEETGARIRRVREALRNRLAQFAPELEVIGDLAPRDYRLYPDGLHPFAAASARYASNLHKALFG